MDCDFLLEFRLRELDNDLAHLHSSCMSLFEQMLNKFLAVFPTFTDHTLLHTLNVTNITNQMLRNEVQKLNAEEIYVYLMATALHDIGMGVDDRNINAFIDSLGIRDYVNSCPNLSRPTLIRMFHNDFSYAFVLKYWDVLEIPNERYAIAIAEVSRGHRKTDLFDESIYPTDYDLGEGKTANLALLAALLRLCDELDVASDRNPDLLYDFETMDSLGENDFFEFFKHEAIHTLEFTEDTIVIIADTERPNIAQGVVTTINKVNKTLQYSFDVIKARSDVKLDCQKIKLIVNGEEKAL